MWYTGPYDDDCIIGNARPPGTVSFFLPFRGGHEIGNNVPRAKNIEVPEAE